MSDDRPAPFQLVARFVDDGSVWIGRDTYLPKAENERLKAEGLDAELTRREAAGRTTEVFFGRRTAKDKPVNAAAYEAARRAWDEKVKDHEARVHARWSA